MWLLITRNPNLPTFCPGYIRIKHTYNNIIYFYLPFTYTVVSTTYIYVDNIYISLHFRVELVFVAQFAFRVPESTEINNMYYNNNIIKYYTSIKNKE